MYPFFWGSFFHFCALRLVQRLKARFIWDENKEESEEFNVCLGSRICSIRVPLKIDDDVHKGGMLQNVASFMKRMNRCFNF